MCWSSSIGFVFKYKILTYCCNTFENLIFPIYDIRISEDVNRDRFCVLEIEKLHNRIINFAQTNLKLFLKYMTEYSSNKNIYKQREMIDAHSYSFFIFELITEEELWDIYKQKCEWYTKIIPKTSSSYHHFDIEWRIWVKKLQNSTKVIYLFSFNLDNYIMWTWLWHCL